MASSKTLSQVDACAGNASRIRDKICVPVDPVPYPAFFFWMTFAVLSELRDLRILMILAITIMGSASVSQSKFLGHVDAD